MGTTFIGFLTGLVPLMREALCPETILFADYMRLATGKQYLFLAAALVRNQVVCYILLLYGRACGEKPDETNSG